MKRSINEDSNDDNNDIESKMTLAPENVDFDRTWTVLQQTVKHVLMLDHIPREVWFDRFKDVYSLCVSYPEQLADRLYKETKALLENHVISIKDYIKFSGEQNLLKCYYEKWNDYSKGINYLNSLYQYLNQQHIKKKKPTEEEIIYGNLSTDPQNELMEIGELGLEIWKRSTMTPIKYNLIKLVFKEMQQDRIHAFNGAIVQGIVQPFIYVEQFNKYDNLQLYIEAFETPLLKEYAEHYKGEASRFLQESDAPQYVERVIEMLKEESLRSSKYLHSTSTPKITECLLEQMVTAKLQFLHGECGIMVREEREKDLTNMYKLLQSVNNGLDNLVNEVCEYIKAAGTQALAGLQGENIHTQFVSNMVRVHRKYSAMIREVFLNDPTFLDALHKACCSVINVKQNPNNPCQAPEMLVKYTDSLLRKYSRGMLESELDEQLTDSIIIIKCIDDKDVFQKLYARSLAKRLTHQQSSSMDAEELMINKLKQTLGYEYTCKLHRLFMDISLSRDLNNDFNIFLETRNTNLEINFFINVFESGAWPSQICTSTFTVPQKLEKSVHIFETFYHERFSGRKLTWLHHMCQGELKLNYLTNPYLVTMQNFQMAILLAFEKTDTLSGKELKEILQLNDDSFVKCLSSLIDSELLVVDDKNVTENTVLGLNMNYSNKRTKFRITATLKQETSQEVQRIHSSVDKGRIMNLQVVIIRIMKIRKVLKHNALIQEVLSRQSKFMFKPSIGMIKKCIEILITKQYIERTSSTDEYCYAA